MLVVADLVHSKLPREFINTLPKSCPDCGSPTVITETLSMLQCSNKNCGAKVVQRAVMMMAELGIKNLGESKIQDFMETYNQDSPYGIIAYAKGYLGLVDQFETKIMTMIENGDLKVNSDFDLTTKEYRDLVTKYEPRLANAKFGSKISVDFTRVVMEQFRGKFNMPLWEYVRLGNLPKIKDSALKLLKDYDDLQKFYNDIESKGITYIQELLGIKTVQEVYQGLTPIRFMKLLSEKGIKDNAIQSIVMNTFVDHYTTFEATLIAMENNTYAHDDLYINGQWVNATTVQQVFYPILKEFVDNGKETKEVTSVMALDIFNILLEHKTELLQYVIHFDIEKIKDISINVCISTSVGHPYSSKVEFEHIMKKKHSNKLQINFVKSVTQDCDFLICGNTAMATTKLKKAKGLQDKGHHIKIMTGSEFDHYVTEL